MPFIDPEMKRAADAAYYRANAAKVRARALSHYAANRDARMEAMREYRNDNVARLRIYDADRHAENPERARSASRRRKASMRGAEGTHTAADVAEIAKAQRHRCAYCRADLRGVARHEDHIIPISKGGSNWRSNIQLLCAPCNLQKHASDPLDFARRIGRLL